MTALEQLRTLYFSVTKATVADDFGRAIDLFKQLTTEEEREKAAVFMEGIAEMRREWGADAKGGGSKGGGARTKATASKRQDPGKPRTRPR
jgi:hypothetical protein